MGDTERGGWQQRLWVALVGGFIIVFAFAAVLQATAEFVRWLTNTNVYFLFPQGIAHAFVDMPHLINVVLGLVLVSIAFAGILFWRMSLVEERPSATDWIDRE